MALVMKNDMVSKLLENKLAITGGVSTSVIIDDTTHMDIITYPTQENFESGAILALIKKPFIDFAISCGKAGDMTVEMISAKYGDQIPEIMAETLVADFAKAYGNYKIIPDGMTLAITAAPINSIFDIMIKEEPKNNDENK